MKAKSLPYVYLDLAIIAAGFALLAYLFRFPYLYALSGVAALSAVHPKTARAVSTAWQAVGKFLGKINSSILLSVFFAIVITPLALMHRLTSRGKKNTAGNWKPVSGKTDFSKPY